MKRVARIAVLMIVLLFTSAIAGAGSAAAKNVSVLVYARAAYGGSQEIREGSIAAASLRSIGYTVTQTEYLPEDLSQYTTIWSVRGFEAMSQHDIERLSSYVSGGGHLMLTGDGPWSDNVNESNQAIARSVLIDKEIVVGQQGFVTGEMTFNSNALGRAAVKPNRLTEFLGTTAGGISGIGGPTSPNVLASNGTTPVAAVFDEGDMESGDGRLLIYMNLDWLGRYSAPSPAAGAKPGSGASVRPYNVPVENDTPTRRLEVVENVQDFLENTPGRRRPPSAEYVALGDSYSAGVGSFDYLPGTTSKNGGCFKAVHGYAENLAEKHHYTLHFAACNGNTLSNLTEGKHAQLKQLGPDTKYVTISIGGNDVGFSSVLESCITGFFHKVGGEKGCAENDMPVAEQALEYLRVGRPPGEYKNPGGNGTRHNVEYLPSLQHLYEMILEQAPQAHLVVLQYPLLMETDRTPFVDCQVGTALLGAVKLSIAASDIEWIDASDTELDTVIEEAVQGARVATGNRDIQFANPRPRFKGHAICDQPPEEEPSEGVEGSEEPLYMSPLLFGQSPKLKTYLEGPKPGETLLAWWVSVIEYGSKTESFHPTYAGQMFFQEAIEDTGVL